MRIVTFGEVMARLAAPGFLRLRQALPGTLDVTFAGAEANVAASLAMLGADVAFVTALPKHALADACIGALHGLGIDTRHVVRTDVGRLGLYFLETGANQRPSQVIYDREMSSVGMTPGDLYDWPTIFEGGGWLHTTGITPAISAAAANAAIDAAQAAKAAGLTVSCDLNFRKKLWRWDPQLPPRQLAETTMRRLLPHVDILIANEEDCHDVLGIRAGNTDVDAGQLDVQRYPSVAGQVADQFPNTRYVAITLRESISASHNNWGAMLYDAQTKRAYFAPQQDGSYCPYAITHIVDRVGGGDAFAAGLIYALNTPDLSAPGDAVAFATAASCLAHSIVGDFHFATRGEIEALMRGARSGRVIR